MQISANIVEQASVLSSEADSAAGNSRRQSSSTPVATKTSVFVPVVNPASHIDPALGIVVVERYGSDGEISDQYPTAHMLQQYSLFGFSSASES